MYTRLSTAGTLLATASDDGSVKLWDASSGQMRSKLSVTGSAAAGVSVLAAAVKGDLVAGGTQISIILRC